MSDLSTTAKWLLFLAKRKKTTQAEQLNDVTQVLQNVQKMLRGRFARTVLAVLRRAKTEEKEEEAATSTALSERDYSLHVSSCLVRCKVLRRCFSAAVRDPGKTLCLEDRLLEVVEAVRLQVVKVSQDPSASLSSEKAPKPASAGRHAERPSTKASPRAAIFRARRARGELEDFSSGAFFGNAAVEAAAHGDLQTLKDLLRGAPSSLHHMHTRLRYSCLHAAADFGQDEVIRHLCKAHRVDVNLACRRLGRNALAYAADSTRWRTCHLLVALGSSRKHVDWKGMNAAQIALENVKANELEQVSMLREPPAKIDEVRVTSLGARSVTFDVTPPKEVPFRAKVQTFICCGEIVGVRRRNPDFDAATEFMAQEYVRGAFRLEDFLDDQNVINVASATPRCLRVERLFPANEYVFRFTTSSLAGRSEVSAHKRVETLADVPSAPGKPFSLATTSTSVTVGWVPSKFENGSSIACYEVHRQFLGPPFAEPRDQGACGTCDVLKRHTSDPAARKAAGSSRWAKHRVPTGTYSHAFTSFPMNACARFRVFAYNGRGCSAASIEAVLCAQSPIRFPEIRPRCVLLEWTVPVYIDPVAYEINVRDVSVASHENAYRVVDQCFTPRSHPAPPADEPPHMGTSGEEQVVCYSVASLVPGSRYQFRVRARERKKGWLPWAQGMTSDVVQTIPDVPSAPGVPSPDPDRGSATTVLLSWKASHPNGRTVILYEVWMSTDHGDYRRIMTCIHCEATVVDLDPSSHFRFKVRGRNDVGFSPFSRESAMTETNRISMPGVPAVTSCGESWARVSWAAPASRSTTVDEYQVYMIARGSEDFWDYAPPLRLIVGSEGRPSGARRKPSPFEKWHAVAQTPETSCLIPDLRSSYRYQFKVRCSTVSGFSPFSAASEVWKLPRRH